MAEEKKIGQTVRLSKNTAEAVRKSVELLNQCGYEKLAQNVQTILHDVSRNRFTVAVVGEFSRGKSTFLNNLLEVEALPVGNMPTTAMLTRIRYAAKPGLVYFDEKGVRRSALPLEIDSWDGLVADNFGGADPRGVVFAGVNNPWLAKHGLEFLDTPGAGDLEEGRARLIGDALLTADAAVIAISATQAMSLSEKLFIEQRLIARKTPYMMLVLTKLDQIPESQRGQMIEFVKNKLTQWGMDIPVFIPQQVSVPAQYGAITGMDKVKNQIQSWVIDPKRVALTERWVLARVDALVSTALDSINEELTLATADQNKKEELLQTKRNALIRAQSLWEDLIVQMEQRSAKAYELVQKRIQKAQQSITERLQYEASHAAQPERWWREDHPYRLKVELTNMASGVENVLSRAIADDVRWFNASLEKSFKTSVLVPKTEMEESQEISTVASNMGVAVENLDKQRSAARVATSAVSILGAISLSCVGLGFLSVIATMGVGTGASLVSDHIFKGKIEKQREKLKEAIAQEVPGMVNNAARDSQRKIKSVYGEIVSAAKEKQQTWMETQTAAVEKTAAGNNGADVQVITHRLEALNALRNSLGVASV